MAASALSARHDGLVVVVGRGHHVVAGKEEDGREAEQGKVDAVVPGVVEDALDAIGRRRHTEKADDEGHILIHRLALQLSTLAALGGAQFLGQFRLLGEVVRRTLELAHALLGLFRELGQPAGSFLRLLTGKLGLEHPHGHDADRHGKRGVACRAEDVGQGKAGGPEEDREEVEPLHHLQGHGLRFRREMEEGQRQLVRKEERRQVHDPGTRISQQQQAAGVPDSLLFLRLRPGTGPPR